MAKPLDNQQRERESCLAEILQGMLTRKDYDDFAMSLAQYSAPTATLSLISKVHW